MAEKRRKRNTQIPEEAIERAASNTAQISVCCYALALCCEKTIQIPTKENTELQTTEGKEISSADLGVTVMEIPVQESVRQTKKDTKQKEGSERGE